MAARERSESGGSPSAGAAAAGPEGQGIRALPEVSARVSAAEAENRNRRSGSRPAEGLFIWSVPIRTTPVFKQTCTYVQVCASVLFFWTVHCAAVSGFAAYGCGIPLAGAARFLFGKTEKKMGGGMNQPSSWLNAPVPARAPARPSSRSFYAPAGDSPFNGTALPLGDNPQNHFG